MTHTLENRVLFSCIGKRSGIGEIVSAKTEDMPLVSINVLLDYGFQRYVNDKIGGSDTNATQKIAAAKDIVLRLLNGEVERASRSSVDPLLAETRNQVRTWLRANKPDLWKKVKALETADEKNEFYDMLAEKSDTFEKLAAAELKRRAAERAKLAEIDIGDVDLDDDSDDDDAE